MNVLLSLARSLVCLLFVLAGAGAQAGRTCENKAPSVPSVERAMQLAQRTAEQLDASGAQVAVLARIGQNLSRYGLRYSHLGFAYRETTSDGAATVWRVVHKLNQCGTAHAALYRQGLANSSWMICTRTRPAS